MKTKSLTLCLMLVFLGSWSTNAQALVAGLTGDLLVKDVLRTASDEVGKRIDQATRNGDYLLERNLGRLDLILQNLESKLSDDLEKRIEDLDEVQENAMLNLNNTAEKAIKMTAANVLKVEEFLFMDISTLANSIPFLKTNIFISSIQGYGQKFREQGSYTVTFRGNAFNPGNQNEIFINNQRVADEWIDDSPHNELTINIPAKVLNSLFTDSEVKRVPLSLKTIKKKETTWKDFHTWFNDVYDTLVEYKGKMQLLPKLPVTSYELIEYVDTKVWSDEEYPTTFENGHAYLLASPKKGTSTGTIRATIPAGALLVQDVSKITKKTSLDGDPRAPWSGFRDFTFHSETNPPMLEAFVWHQITEGPVDFWMTCRYKILVAGKPQEKLGYLQANGKEMKGRLGYGTYTYPVSENYGSYNLKILFFNGDVVHIISKKGESQGGLTTNVQSITETSKILIVEIKEI